MAFSFENMMFIFFFIEIIIVIILLSVIVIGKALFNLGNRYSSRLYQKLSRELANSLAHNTPFNYQLPFKTFYHLTTLLSVLETFSHRFKGGEWDELKNEISRRNLIETARKWSKSHLWIRRNYSARVFALTSYTEDEPTILHLMDDKIFLVRSIASIAAVNNEQKDGIYKILKEMSEGKSYSYYFYRDILLAASEKVLLWVEEFAALEKPVSFRLACLDVLEQSYLPLSQLSLDKDFSSDNPNLRLAACKIYANNPQKDSHEKLIEALNDENVDIRSEAVKGLSQFYSPETIKALENTLKDNHLHVRVQAGLTLAQLGEKGINALKAQNKSVNTNAYEAAQYALQFNEGL